MNVSRIIGLYLCLSIATPLWAQFAGTDDFSDLQIDTGKWVLMSDQKGTASFSETGGPNGLYFSAGGLGGANDDVALLRWIQSVGTDINWTVGAVVRRPTTLALSTNSHVEIGLSIWASGAALTGGIPNDMFSFSLDLYRDASEETVTVYPGIFTSSRDDGLAVVERTYQSEDSVVAKIGVSYNATEKTLSTAYATLLEDGVTWSAFTPFGTPYSTATWDFTGSATPSFQMGILGAANNYTIAALPAYGVMALGFQTTLGSPVPEPSTYAALLGLGALGFAYLRRRR